MTRSIWKSSYVNWEWTLSSDAPGTMAVLAIGFPLAELVTDLQQRAGGRVHLEALNQAYHQFRLAASAPVRQGAATTLCQRLEDVAAAYPELTSKSADLQSHIHEVLRHAG